MTTSQHDLHVAYILSDEFVLPFVASATSVAENTGHDSVCIHVLFATGNLTRRHRERIDDVLELPVDFIRVSHTRFEVFDNPRFGVEAFLKLLIPEKLSRLSKCLYLDCDTIVRADIASLFRTPMDGCPVAAVQDAWIPYVSSPEGVQLWEELGLDAETPFFNSGVLLLDLEMLRDMDLLARARRYVRAHRNEMNKMGDQEVQNALLAGHWKSLDLSWNAVPPLYRRSRRPTLSLLEEKGLSESDVTRRAKIIHFTGFLERPWKAESRYTRPQPHPERSTFNRYLWKSGWFSLPEWYAYQASFYRDRTVETLRDLTRPLRHRTRQSVAAHLGFDLPFLGGAPSLPEQPADSSPLPDA
jgi:lipopolysaccharide biosynthesis glycosyltransferase